MCEATDIYFIKDNHQDQRNFLKIIYGNDVYSLGV